VSAIQYAQIDEKGIVCAVTQAVGKMIEIGLLYTSLLGKRYNPEIRQF